MKIIEGLKKIKDLYRKADDVRGKIRKYCVKMSFEQDHYENQGDQVKQWIQSHKDLIKEIENLRERIARTNLGTKVTLEINGNEVTKSIHSWISRRRDLISLEVDCWKQLDDKGLNDQKVKMTNGEVQEFKVVRFFDYREKDAKLDDLKSELSLIDSRLEIINATTDLLD